MHNQNCYVILHTSATSLELAINRLSYINILNKYIRKTICKLITVSAKTPFMMYLPLLAAKSAKTGCAWYFNNNLSTIH